MTIHGISPIISIYFVTYPQKYVIYNNKSNITPKVTPLITLNTETEPN